MLGATKSQKIDVRLISASNAMLDEQIKNGTFREDLFYRLNVITIHIPPLRDRKEDIPLLIDYFTNRYCKEYDKKPLKISKQIRGILTAYTWPGNVRELENFINRMVLMSDMQMNVDDIPVHMKMSSPKVIKDDLTMTLAEAEKNYIIKVLESCGNNKTKAAEILGIDRKTLREKLK
jgi:two-component system response regulator HydG